MKREKNLEDNRDLRTILEQASQTWRQPEELKGSRPREVCLTVHGKFMAVAAFVMMLTGLTVGIGLYVKFSRDGEMQKRIVQSGVTTEALITEHWISKANKSPYFVRYEYQVEGKAYRGERSIDLRSGAEFAKKGSLGIRYLSSDPAKHSVPGHDPEIMQSWLAFLFAGAFFLSAGIILRRIVLQYQLLAEGLGSMAVVVRVRLFNNLWQRVAHYMFMDRNGTLFKGKTSPQVSMPSKGTMITIVYKPENERHNMIYPVPFVRVKKT